MTNADAMRASDADRERVVRALQEQVGEGRLTLPEFEERTHDAYAAKTVGELRELTRDLPVEPIPTVRTAPPWPQPMGMPPMPPWRPPVAARPEGLAWHPVMVLLAMLLGLAVVADVVAAAVWHGPLIFPVFLVAFLLLRTGRRRRWR